MAAMLETAKLVLLIVSGLFPIVNPLGGAPIFLALTDGYPEQARRALARRIAINSFFLIVGSYLVGSYILAFFGISLPVVQVGGGLVVVSTGWRMLQQPEPAHHEHVRDVGADALSRAFYPLTLPLTVGPGSISVAITLGANAQPAAAAELLTFAAALIGAAVIALSVFLCYGFANRLARALGPTAMSVILRLSSFLLVCIGVQIVWNGVSALLGSMGPGR